MKPEIDIPRALELKSLGLTWREVGELLAEESGRVTHFQSGSVQGAVARNKNKTPKINLADTDNSGILPPHRGSKP